MRLPPSYALERRERILVVAQLWLVEILALVWLCSTYTEAASPETFLGRVFLTGGALSCAASLSLVPGLLTLGLGAFLRSRRALGALAVGLWSASLFLVYVDTRLYGIFRYHFNGLVWNVLTTPGADEAVHLSPREIALVLGVFAAQVPLQYGAFAWLWRMTARRNGLAVRPPTLLRPKLAWMVLLVPNMLVVAGVYAWADLTRDPYVMAYSRVYPLYPRLTIKRFVERKLGIAMKDRPEVDLPSKGILLAYPLAEPAMDTAAPRPNIVVITIDSLRSDMLGPEVMPRTWALAQGGRRFENHLSSGNATRFGLFGMIYGLHGSYWKPIRGEHRSPVLVDALLARGYDFRVLTSASMDFPEFRSTAWVRIEDKVEDRLPTQREGGRDDGVAARFEEWLGEIPPSQPFFSFLLLDAPHQSYSFPEECAVFRPYLDQVAYTSIGSEVPEEVRIGLHNRYRNAVHYADQTTGRILDALEAHGRGTNTIVVVTGDHGEEFFENGFFGHTSNFTREQIQVPMVLAGPGVPPGQEHRPTCHIDLPGTLLELVGADPAQQEQWTLGQSLLDPPSRRVRVASGWDNLGLHFDERIIEVPMAGYGGTEIAVYDTRWRRTFDDDAFLDQQGGALGTLAAECRRFLR